MGQGHGDRLSPLDAAFLNLETPSLHMHVGGVFVFRPQHGRTFDFQRFQRLVRSRLHLVPRHRQRLAASPLGLAQPVWVDDPNFDLAYHLRHAALPRPGGRDQLLDYATRILSRQLDRDRPLWELYVVEGLADGDVALVAKNHHAMIDGLAGVDIMDVLLDEDPAAHDDIPEPAPWDPGREPSTAARAVAAVRDLARRPSQVVDVARRAVDGPLEFAGRAATLGRGVVSTASSLFGPAPRSVLNQEPGRQRRMALETLDLATLKTVKDAFHTTVNDVVLAMVGDMLGRYLRHRHQASNGVELRVMVPVSMQESRPGTGNTVTPVFVDLPVGEMDPVARLRLVSQRMTEVTASRSAMGADALLDLSGFAPPTLQAVAARVATTQRLYNVLVTNAPGPQVPIHALGARLVGAYPFVPLAGTQALGIGLISLDGAMHVGFTADYDALPDVSILPDLLTRALEDLATSAAALHR